MLLEGANVERKVPKVWLKELGRNHEGIYSDIPLIAIIVESITRHIYQYRSCFQASTSAVHLGWVDDVK